MAIAIDSPNTGIARGRGGFMRGANDVPWITDPSGAVVKSGARKGEPKRLAYGSPSNRGKQIENTTNLVKWGERRVVLGIGATPELVEMCAGLVGLDVDSDEYKTLADSIIIKAKDAAKANLAAERGTHGHALTEDHDGDRDWIARAEAGEVLGLDLEVQQALVDAWRDMLERTGLEILAVEASCVDDTWRLAGTLDRIARTTKPLRFALPGGEIREVPAGCVLVLDVKSGQRRTDRSGAVMYWQSYAIQIASYAQAVPYDTEAETRGEWPWVIDQDHALIAHLDIEGALARKPECDLVYVDLRAGREHGGECVVMAKQWEARRDLFSVAMLPDEIAVSAPTPPDAPATTAAGPAEPTTAAEPHTGADTAPTASERAGDPAPADAPGDATTGEVAPPASPVVATPQQQVEAVRARPADEGVAVDDPTFDVLQRAYQALAAEGRAWIASLTEQATRGLVPFHTRGHRTARRFEIVRALVLLAQRGDHDDETVRGLLEPIIGDCAQFPSVPVGHLVGSLSATEAAQFSGLVDGRYSISCDDRTGRPILKEAA